MGAGALSRSNIRSGSSNSRRLQQIDEIDKDVVQNFESKAKQEVDAYDILTAANAQSFANLFLDTAQSITSTQQV